MTKRDPIDQFNDTFKLGRNAGQEDVCMEILRYDPSFAHKIAREYLSRIPGHELGDVLGESTLPAKEN